LALRRRIGFGPAREVERFAVLQSDLLSASVDTVIVAPLDERYDFYDQFPAAVPVAGREAGARVEQVVVLSQLAAIAIRKFEPVAVGRLTAATLRRIEAVLEAIFDLG
jgi:mRNA-degrading endonuclease toxin of MazEF toxin-antitoxin module